MTQVQFARFIGAGQGTVSRIESASMKVTLDQIVYALFAFNVSDEEIAAAFNAGALADVRRIRDRAGKRLARRASPGFLRQVRRRAASAGQISYPDSHTKRSSPDRSVSDARSRDSAPAR